MGKWLKKNAVSFLSLGIAALIIWALVFRNATSFTGAMTDLGIWVVVAFGIGMLIFLHELGHFLAAKLCNVHVETFSIGFGPAIPGCSFRWGETFYKLAWIPLGGYVKMKGEYPNEQMDEEIKNDPRAFMNKTVGQRMIIISAGVVVNVIVGMICFSIVYNAGKDTPAPAVSHLEPGSPAALSGLEPGSRIVAIDDQQNPTFEDLLIANMFSRPDFTQIRMKWRTPGGEEREGILVPQRVGEEWKPQIGAGFPISLNVIKPEKKDAPVATPNSPAAAASFKPGDHLLAVRLAEDKEPIPLTDGWQYTALEGKFRGKPIVVTVQRGEEKIEVPVGPRYFRSFGLRLEPGEIVGLVDSRYRPAPGKDFELGDVIVGFNGDRTFDALRLPDLIWEQGQKGGPIKLTVLRAGKELDFDIKPEDVREHGTWEEQSPSNKRRPVGIPALGVAYKVRPVLRGVDPGSPAEEQHLQAGDTIQAVTYEKSSGKKETEELGDVQWPPLFLLFQHSAEAETIDLKVVDKSGNERTVTLTSVEDKTWPFPHRGLRREVEVVKLKAANPLDAVGMGFRDTFRKIAQMYMGMHSVASGSVDAKEGLSGPFRILQLLYDQVKQGWVMFIFLLGFISINLAVVNFLPIPILDGGHMVFLIVEKIRGKPASERVLIVATLVGLVFIAALMLTVILLDFRKFGWLDFLW